MSYATIIIVEYFGLFGEVIRGHQDIFVSLDCGFLKGNHDAVTQRCGWLQKGIACRGSGSYFRTSIILTYLLPFCKLHVVCDHRIK